MEFAIVVWPFFLLAFMALQTALLFFVDQALQTATTQGARLVMTGQAAGMSAGAYKTAVCAKLPSLFNCTNLMVDVQSSPTYAGLNTTPLTPTYTKNPLTGKYTLNNSGWAYSQGSPTNVVILRVMYDFPVIGGAFAFANQPDGSFLLAGTSVFKNEPYPTS